MNARSFVAQVARLLIWEEFVKDRLVEDGVKPTPDAIHAYQSDLDYLEGQDTTLEELIRKAREIEKANVIPTRNFVEGAWSFRIKTMARNGKETGVAFDIYRKGERSHWAIEASVTQSGDCWIVSPRNGYTDAFASWSEAKAHALTLIGAK